MDVAVSNTSNRKNQLPYPIQTILAVEGKKVATKVHLIDDSQRLIYMTTQLRAWMKIKANLNVSNTDEGL